MYWYPSMRGFTVLSALLGVLQKPDDVKDLIETIGASMSKRCRI
jgi:hypothetical protein